MHKLSDEIQAASEEDIRKWNRHAWDGSNFHTFFDKLAQSVSIEVPKVPKSTNQAPTYEDTSINSTFSTSYKSDKPEYTAHSCLEARVDDTLTEAENVSVIDQDWEFAVLVSLPVNDSSGIG